MIFKLFWVLRILKGFHINYDFLPLCHLSLCKVSVNVLLLVRGETCIMFSLSLLTMNFLVEDFLSPRLTL